MIIINEIVVSFDYGHSYDAAITTWCSLIRDKVSFAVLINYTLLSIVVIGFDETYPLWAADSPELGTYN